FACHGASRSAPGKARRPRDSARVTRLCMSAGIISPRTQVTVLIILLLLTGLTTGVSFLDLSGTWHLAAGLVIAAAKASLVVLFFMHVIHSPAATRAVIAVAVFWLVGILVALTMSDYTTRQSL